MHNDHATLKHFDDTDLFSVKEEKIKGLKESDRQEMEKLRQTAEPSRIRAIFVTEKRMMCFQATGKRFEIQVCVYNTNSLDTL